MAARILRFLWSLFNAYSFYSNPVQYLVTTLVAALVPILVYAVAGIVGFTVLIIVILFLIYRFAFSSKAKASPENH
ncbi:hypothetical protein EP331_09580 [bacterium]|nr:MAG: hypothetical protein EP331_09580 [bacterium]